MPSISNDPIICRTSAPSGPENYNGGIYGESTLFNGVRGVSYAAGHGGVVGVNDNTSAEAGPGVFGVSKGAGVAGESHGFNGIRGISHAAGHGACVGVNDNPTAEAGPGVYGESTHGVGVVGKGGRLAALFDGDVEVTGDIRLANADCAEDFNVMDLASAEPGTVMVIGEVGDLMPCGRAYDKRVAGVVSGAGDYKPGIVLDNHALQPNRRPIALLGKVFCKVDAAMGSIEVGDLLTTSPTSGHAMRAADPAQAPGTVIGKALRPHREGLGLIPILIALQ